MSVLETAAQLTKDGKTDEAIKAYISVLSSNGTQDKQFRFLVTVVEKPSEELARAKEEASIKLSALYKTKGYSEFRLSTLTLRQRCTSHQGPSQVPQTILCNHSSS